MKLDLVHDIQSVFRKTVKAYSFPGTIGDISQEAAKVDEGTGFPQTLLLLAFMLLDGDTTFAVCANDAATGEKIISRLTYAKSAPVQSADFIFVPDADFDPSPAIEGAKEGTLPDPHLGATVIALTSGFKKSDNGFELSGPGIDTPVSLDFCKGEKWAASRSLKNREYPLGIDMMFVSEGGELVCLPRTTRIRANGEAR